MGNSKSAKSQKLASQHRGLMMKAEFPALSAWFAGSSTGQVVSLSSTVLTVYVCLGKTRLCDSCKFLGLSETCEFTTWVSVNLTLWDGIHSNQVTEVNCALLTNMSLKHHSNCWKRRMALAIQTRNHWNYDKIASAQCIWAETQVETKEATRSLERLRWMF